jgi:sec-independent protein translocase protein TatC
VITFLQRPLHEQLYYTSPTASFEFVMQVCLLCGFLSALPMFLYNTLRFIEPAFERCFSRQLLLTVIGSSLLLAAAGLTFGYYLTLPFALKFFSSVGTSSLHPLITVNEYFSFVVGYLATFAIVF